jgi:ABC-type polysaccharide/polyol phosphate transport system ATPase subunit
MARIELDKVSLTFRVRPFGRITLKEFLISRLRGRAGTRLMKVRALQDVSLAIGEGERVGIIGHNGAGKSTLLRLLAGIYPPTRGRRAVEGRISSLFDITLGFEPDANGWENIAYRGYLQGETPRTIRSKTQAIAEFAELGDFLNMPVRYYSAGMLVRLAFSIATAVDPEILLVDEVLSVGDLSFQQRAQQRMRDMMDRARLIVAVSHDLGSLAKLCDRAVWMDHGQVRQVGPVAEVTAAYMDSVRVAQTQAAA